MSGAALFIDLPNFYSRLLKSGIEDPRFLRDYFIDWLDFDLLARSLAEEYSGIWIFYSGERLGPSSQRIEGKRLSDYVRRINALQGVTARDVNIPGEQREPISYRCEKCGNEGRSETISEKGVDSSLTVHLFDTMDSWDAAYLLSGDADFVPAVQSLRRRGKIVVGAGFPGASEALVRECYDYVYLPETFISEDVLAYTLFGRDSIARRWLGDEVKYDANFGVPETVELFVQVMPWSTAVSQPSVYFSYRGPIDLAARHLLIDELLAKHPKRTSVGKRQDGVVDGFAVSIAQPLAFEAISRGGARNLSSIQGLDISRKDNYWVTYSLNQATQKYEPMSK